jgi:type IV pilus assembly protein PilN
MSALNLMPWRERQRQAALRRWAWGVALMLCLSTALVTLISQQLQPWHQHHTQQQQDWSNAQQLLKGQLAEAALWQGRARQAQQVRVEGLQWLQQQQQPWRVLRRVLALPPHGVQMTQLAWQDKQLIIRGWAVSAAHLQVWQDTLQLQRVEWQEAQWRDADGLAMRQHAFVLQGPFALSGACS